MKLPQFRSKFAWFILGLSLVTVLGAYVTTVMFDSAYFTATDTAVTLKGSLTNFAKLTTNAFQEAGSYQPSSATLTNVSNGIGTNLTTLLPSAVQAGQTNDGTANWTASSATNSSLSGIATAWSFQADSIAGLYGIASPNALLPVLSWPGNENFFVGSKVGNLNITGAAGGTAGVRNIGLGYDILENLTTNGHRNLGVGFSVMSSMLDGSYNTVVGMAALDASTNSVHNAGLGHHVFRLDTSGSWNTSLGDYTLELNTTGNYNTTVGYLAGNAVNADANVYVGVQSGLSNVLGTLNTLVGSYTGRSLTNASYNVGVGYGTLDKTTDGSYNTAVGAGALGSADAGPYNVALGYNAGPSITGQGNVIVGANATTITSGNNNIVMGYDPRLITASGSSQLNIGNLLFATGLGGLTTMGTGNVGVGVQIPGEKLEVAGSIKLSGISSSIQGGHTNQIATSGTPQTIFYVSVPNTNSLSGDVIWKVFATDGTDTQSQVGHTWFDSVAKGTAVTAGVSNIVNVTACSAGTITGALSANVATNNVLAIQAALTTTLSTTNMLIKWRIETPSVYSVTMP